MVVGIIDIVGGPGGPFSGPYGGFGGPGGGFSASTATTTKTTTRTTKTTTRTHCCVDNCDYHDIATFRVKGL